MARRAAWEQAVLEQVGMGRTYPLPYVPPGSVTRLAVVFNNAVGNKIDYYLSANATYEVTADARTPDRATARLDVTIDEDAAADDGEPG